MVKRQVGGVRVEDTRTGERYNLFLEKVQASDDGTGPWMKLYLGGTSRLLSKAGRLSGEVLWVLLHCEALVSWGNLLPVPAKMAHRLGMLRQHVSRAYGELMRAGFLLKYEGDYYLSPVVGWRGTPTQLKEAYMLWYPERQRELQEPEKLGSEEAG